MKQLLTRLMILFIIISGQIMSVYGENDEDSTTIEVDIDPKIDLPSKGQRMPSIPLICHINMETGVSITGVVNTDIISFELYDNYDICIGTFADEWDFVEVFFSELSWKIHKICFETEDARYTGYVN